MTYCFDIDGTICTGGEFPFYAHARPIPEMIERIKRLKAEGHRIVLWTARGSSYPMTDELRTRTLEQMCRWGVPFDELRFGKPAADYYIDDRGVSADYFMENW